MGLGSLCISTFQSLLEVGGMPGLSAMAFQALWSLGVEAFPLYLQEGEVILVPIAIPPCP